MEEHNALLSSIYQAVLTSSSKAVEPLKVKLLVDGIGSRFSLSWEGIAKEGADVGLHRMADYDIILSCTDNALARVETMRAARVLGLPMIDAGVMGDGITQGRVTYFAPHLEAACYLCGIAEARRAEILAYASSTSLGCRALEDFPSMTGTLETVRKTAAALLAILRRWEAGPSMQASFARRIVSNGSNRWTYEEISIVQSVTCPWHVEEAGHWVTLDEDRPIREALSARNIRLQLLWPQCLEACCRQCGSTSRPLQRVAWVRRKMVCAACGASGATDPIRVIESVGVIDLEADCTPRQLGLPNRHLYLLRRTFVPATRKDADEPVA
jgi:molybdopterin/thiamine biosynthesis adenylyltransferase